MLLVWYHFPEVLVMDSLGNSSTHTTQTTRWFSHVLGVTANFCFCINICGFLRSIDMVVAHDRKSGLSDSVQYCHTETLRFILSGICNFVPVFFVLLLVEIFKLATFWDSLKLHTVESVQQFETFEGFVDEPMVKKWTTPALLCEARSEEKPVVLCHGNKQSPNFSACVVFGFGQIAVRSSKLEWNFLKTITFVVFLASLLSAQISRKLHIRTGIRCKVLCVPAEKDAVRGLTVWTVAEAPVVSAHAPHTGSSNNVDFCHQTHTCRYATLEFYKLGFLSGANHTLHHKSFKIQTEDTFKPKNTLSCTQPLSKISTFLTFFMMEPMVAWVEIVTASFHQTYIVYTQSTFNIHIKKLDFFAAAFGLQHISWLQEPRSQKNHTHTAVTQQCLVWFTQTKYQNLPLSILFTPRDFNRVQIIFKNMYTYHLKK